MQQYYLVLQLKFENTIVNLFEYIIKQHSELLNHDIQEVFQRLCYIQENSNSSLVTLEDISNLQNVKFIYQGKEVLEDKLKEKYKLPKYTGEEINKYKEIIIQKLQK